jgi:structural maintenance of chromosome 1
MPSVNKQPDRGCLYKLDVTNFKSYAGKLSIGPFKDFTCVIGPNGSGAIGCLDHAARRLMLRSTMLP